jgi:AcrR family transcriptional regulator
VAASKARTRNPRGQGDRLRVELVDAAIRMLAAVNHEQPLSLRALAREVGIAPQSVYLHFGSKPELLRAVVEALFAELQRRLDQAQGAQTNPTARLQAHCRAYCEYGLRHPGHYQLLFERQLTDSAGLAYEGSPGAKVFDNFVGAVRDCTQCRANLGQDPRYVATAVWVGLHGIVSLRLGKPGFPWPPVQTMIDTMLAGLVGLRTTDTTT